MSEHCNNKLSGVVMITVLVYGIKIIVAAGLFALVVDVNSVGGTNSADYRQ